MRKAVIDIGSNSVRIAIFAGGKVLYRAKITSQLGEGMIGDNMLKSEPVMRTLNAVKKFVAIAEDMGVERQNIFAFATAAVRNSYNGSEFVSLVKDVVNLPIAVLSGEVEAEIALLGALFGNDGAVIDIGGASTEICVAKGGAIVYSRSIKLGAVLLYDRCGANYNKLENVIDKEIEGVEFDVGESLTAIGGTSSALAFIKLGLTQYDRDKTHGVFISKDELFALTKKLFDMSVDERSLLGVGEKRARIICGGALLLYKILDKLCLGGVTVSENDNLEGYFAYLEGKRYEK